MQPDAELEAFARESGLLRPEDTPRWTPLTGGVSSDIWRLDVEGRSVCVKRALPKLRVAADWTVPTERNLYEWRWIETVAAIDPHLTPEPLATDELRGAFAMAFLPAQSYPLWKRQLLDGAVDAAFAGGVGAALARIHAATAQRADIAARFPTDDLFFALRLEPYLLATAEARPEVSAALRALVERTATTHLALVHGDVSPKNILAGPDGPVFLDAECAWYGDPAFDAAFCLNHLLLKMAPRPDKADALAASFDALASSYLAGVTWESRAEIEARTATLLPGLLLARIDGKSPVEYITDESAKARVRAVAIAMLQAPPRDLASVRTQFQSAMRA